MAVAIARKHYLIAIDWSQRMLEQWVEQYGAWLLIGSKTVNLKARGTMQHIVESANGVSSSDKRRRALPRCTISDDEGFAIHDLLLDIRSTDNPVLQEWLNCFELYYIEGLSDERIASILNIGRLAVIQNKKCAIAHICAKRPSIASFLMCKGANS